MKRTAVLFVMTALSLFGEVPTGQEIRSGNVSIMLARSGPTIYRQLGIPFVPGSQDMLQILVKSDDRSTVAFRATVHYLDDQERAAVGWADADPEGRYAMTAVPMVLTSTILSVDVRELSAGGKAEFAQSGSLGPPDGDEKFIAKGIGDCLIANTDGGAPYRWAPCAPSVGQLKFREAMPNECATLEDDGHGAVKYRWAPCPGSMSTVILTPVTIDAAPTHGRVENAGPAAHDVPFFTLCVDTGGECGPTPNHLDWHDVKLAASNKEFIKRYLNPPTGLALRGGSTWGEALPPK